MFKDLARIFKTSSSEAAAAPTKPAAMPVVEAITHINHQEVRVVGFDLDEVFTGLVLGVSAFTETTLNVFEKTVLDQIDEILNADSAEAHEKMLPRLPAVVPQLLNAMKSEDSSGKQLAEQIGHDPVLVGEVIKLANSPYYYKAEHRINSLQRAVVVLGQSGLKSLIASVVMKPIFNTQDGYFGHTAKNYLWAQSEQCAHACSFLCRNRYDAFDAYLAGIVINIGMIVAVRIMDQLHKIKEAPRSAVFYHAVLAKTRLLSAQIAQDWQFPKTVLEALAQQVEGAHPEDMSSLSGALYAANRISQLSVLVEQGCLEDDANLLKYLIAGPPDERYLLCYADLKRVLNSQKEKQPR